MQDKNVKDVNFAVIDTETTGISPRSSRICEIAGVIAKGYGEVSSFSWLVDPEMRMPYSAFAVHGISDAMLAGQPRFCDIAARLLSYLENTVIVGHNIMFDVNFINMELCRIGLKLPKLPVIDTLCLARKSGLFEHNKLSFIAEALHIKVGGWHRALNDVQATRQILYYFMRRIEHEKGFCSLKDIHQQSGGKYVK
ncbi:MAG: 3'-5' exonuclease [Elusimicrobiales bacterium]|nr:3'-5' exonuclease [Elusimicrobiales bacterium]